MILLLDNYDSFTYNVYQYVANLGYPVSVIRNDRITLEEIEHTDYSGIIISPGPGTPAKAGICKAVIARFAGKIPILGICLGHQAIGEVFGGKVIRAPQPVHGKAEYIIHRGKGIYKDLPKPFMAGRYHSLIVDKTDFPDCLEITATSQDGLIMGLRHKEFEVEGVQFHPESILTPLGSKILENFLVKTR
ncbi:Anthranilate synthase component 2 [Sporomusa ovata DSM 2662]|uniref:Anthranilate synthase, amidotransferase component @ Para-aminobenzoate synthase, amidotransferase component n=1 Tax=Sporomusa ovata TaxID=2378 RepID=A0A0U1L4P9_9FIRM|nr:gamma-glutamyl-gamma-aminobutyrate hydrolase family protein [Sporomusa ovata]EQB25729.1 anthranilate synthase component 2 [Sporomusa ovata DSM 2662]CQR74289.1 Anthranilate synthase, amidotransferase component @ Para-aminobenzoate synthase, amidotransferase component [Sporomusa ovata]